MIVDGKIKLKFVLKNATIKFVSNSKEDMILTKEISMADLVQMHEANFSSWEHSLINVNHLM